jgi:lipid-A-disaccharide synthase
MKIALIAGETSGDQLGGWLIEALKKKDPSIEFIGLGGTTMQAQGLKSLFPMEDIALMGIAEVLPHYFAIKRRVREMVEHIEAEKPDILITIDSRGFTYRVVEMLKERGIHRPRFIHYVAPSVWVYRPKRVFTAARLFDEIFCLLPFEPPYFDTVGLKASYVGHEIAWYWREKGDGDGFRARHGIAPGTPLLAIFPGSRRGELKKLLPTIRATVTRLKAEIPTLELLVMVPAYLEARLQQEIAHWPAKTHLVLNTQEKRDLFAAATAALAKSGTVALECALAGLPSVTTYKANPLSVAIFRRIVKIKWFNLANILAGRMIIPELMQDDATPEKLSAALKPLLTYEPEREIQLHDLRDVATKLGATDSISPSDKMASAILAK